MSQRKLGVMLDCSRCAVPKVDFIKRYVDALAKMGYNTLQLYAEDLYEVPNEPYYGYMRGRYSARELKALDAYAKGKGIELIPCVQTLAHVNSLAHFNAYKDAIDCQDILLCESNRTYELIDNIFKTLSECFTSRTVNIGMDEAHMVGFGRYRELHGIVDRFEIMLKHLNEVVNIAEKYGFKCAMWSDMFFRLANGGKYEFGSEFHIPNDLKNLIPKSVSLIYWDYYSLDEIRYDVMLKRHKEFNNEIWFAGGAWTWTGFTPHNAFSIEATKGAINACNNNGVDNVILTVWGDNGGECSKSSILPSLMCAAENFRGNFDMDSIKEKFEKLFGIAFDDFMKLDMPCEIFVDSVEQIINPDKYGLYNDYFLGILDKDCEKLDEKRFSIVKERLENIKNERFGYLFDTLSKLCAVLELKFHLGIKTREAYQRKDVEALKFLVENNYKPLKTRLDRFYKAFSFEWNKENKPFGFEIHEIRLGGLIKRTESCTERLEKFISGELQVIDELEEENIPFRQYDGESLLLHNDYLTTITSGTM